MGVVSDYFAAASDGAAAQGLDSLDDHFPVIELTGIDPTVQPARPKPSAPAPATTQ
ncbi:hypothetical protein [Amycolatopsis sp. FDAARGOS 1241]|uniref:hypothetical protein n=1 Tax=Amycolatopsis sp. FDAARGOS 1241 TaxID=2778070 RepID=UPI00194F9C97|nr:hypothetical protein [Amycolatopsis sp. FDAARGOS 1241]QRP48116.1 hypothetical protein I6J71_09655 [Amycolatopsis sp. FDAARGOS 1241]